MLMSDIFIDELRAIVGRKHVFVGTKATQRFRKGFRSGEGEALCVVQPGTLLEFWNALKVATAADKIVIFQSANTGLTEGSTPKERYERDVVVINTLRLVGLFSINDGEQVISLPGSTLFSLEKLLAPMGRDPHSVIGSSSIGATVVGGVCNNSGGALVERGPAYTELALFARLNEDGELELVNHLEISLGDTPEEILTNLEAGNFDMSPGASNRKASSTDYAHIVREVDASTPSRYNADKSKLYEVSGCAGKLAVFAVRLDTFAKPQSQKVFYIGTNDVGDLTEIRRDILGSFKTLPITAEYMEREVFNMSESYGKDTVILIDWLGTDRLPMFFAMKGAIDARLNRIPLLYGFTDKVMQLFSRVMPKVLPKKMTDYRDQYRHHLILKMKEGGIDEARDYLNGFFADREGDFFECNDREGKLAGLHRFAAAGAAVRYMEVNKSKVEDIIPLDIALRRNDRDWFEVLPAEIDDHLVHKIYYGHLMCHVMHQDYVVKKGVDVKALKAKMLAILDQREAEYPSEHNVGHLYPAKQDLADHYKACDPTNSFNPGLGKMSRKKNYA
ncbi:MAG: D-lactate dehydrogenase [Pseudomonadota bacterium]